MLQLPLHSSLLLLLLDTPKAVCLPTSALCCQAENEALQQLVLEVAQNKQEAQRKVAGLKQKYSNLLAKVSSPHHSHCLSPYFCYKRQKMKSMSSSNVTHKFLKLLQMFC